MGNATLTVFFRPQEDLWNTTRGWEKPFANRVIGMDPFQLTPTYKELSDIPVKDYYMYFEYEYRFIDYVSFLFQYLDN